MNTLEIRQLSKTYSNGVKALQQINLTLENGMFGLLGPNGAGKSSLMRTIATLQLPDKGNVIFNGTDIGEHPQFIRKHLGYLPQEFGVYPKVSAVELLNHMAILKGIFNQKIRKEQIESLLVQTNLYQHRKKAVSSYSGGMKQRFGIAQALLGNPKVIIVDEPTAGLDPEERNRFHNLLSEIGEQVIVVLSTHIVEDVRDLCTKMAVMGDGKILLEGSPKELMSNLNGHIWKKEIKKETLETHQKSFKVISSRLFAGNTQIHVYADRQPEEGFELVDAGLEDVYFSLMRGFPIGRKEGVAC